MSAELELLAFRAGIKPAIRIRGALLAALPHIERVEHGGEVFVYAARDPVTARALRDAERPILPGGPRRTPDAEVLSAHRELGRLLGYPRCCVEAFVERVERGVDVRSDGTRASERFVAIEDANARSTEHLGRLNFSIRDRALVPFDPCAFDCSFASRYADALFALAPDADALRSSLLEPIAILLDGSRVDPRAPADLSVRFDRF